MKKIFLSIIFLLIFAFPAAVNSEEIHSESSAKLNSNIDAKGSLLLDTRVKALKNVFKRYNSPLVDQAIHYVKYADEFDMDWKLLPAIAGLESTFAQRYIQGTYNPYGWGSGRIYFESWEDGIRTINKALRERYVNRGATDVWKIGPIYAESPTWSVRVNRFMQEINHEYLRLTTITSTITI
jgi:hypothetical protein